MSPDVVLDAHAILGEGPVWDVNRQRLAWVDIEAHALHETDPGSGEDRVITIGEHIGCAAPAGGSLYVAGLKSGLAVLDIDTGRRAAIVDPEPHLDGNRFNDGKCDPAGRLWAGTMALDEHEGAGSLYCLRPDLAITRALEGVTVSNGLAWSADARTMYYADSPTRQVAAFDFDNATGALANRRVVYEVPEGSGFPDGMTIDAEDHLWVALWDGWRVIRVAPATGRVVGEVVMPVARPTCCTFGGANLDELFITSARVRLSPEQLAVQPLAGAIFRARPGVRGLPPVPFGGTAQLRAILDAAPG
jgi:sugar lactone lactonase YvrE